MAILMYHLAVIDHAEGHNVVFQDSIHYSKVSLLGAIHISNKIPDFGGKISLHILGVGIVDGVLLEVAQEVLVEGGED